MCGIYKTFFFAKVFYLNLLIKLNLFFLFLYNQKISLLGKKKSGWNQRKKFKFCGVQMTNILHDQTVVLLQFNGFIGVSKLPYSIINLWVRYHNQSESTRLIVS